ncbi:MAG TPA: succinate dehydrogenase assembly factor 2, partial [Gammaproteobacteria bacterium]|nr:succinate dehydrogenase assembly factor 2 [Gammaproteobacteria bacterium]
ARIRLACRRGMLELDLFLLPFFEAVYSTLTEQEQEIFQSMLQQSDQQLQRWLLGMEFPPQELQELIAKIRYHKKSS